MLSAVAWRDGRVAEGGGLLNRCTVKSRTGGSNPPLSAILLIVIVLVLVVVLEVLFTAETPRSRRKMVQNG